MVLGLELKACSAVQQARTVSKPRSKASQQSNLQGTGTNRTRARARTRTARDGSLSIVVADEAGQFVNTANRRGGAIGHAYD